MKNETRRRNTKEAEDSGQDNKLNPQHITDLECHQKKKKGEKRMCHLLRVDSPHRLWESCAKIEGVSLSLSLYLYLSLSLSLFLCFSLSLSLSLFLCLSLSLLSLYAMLVVYGCDPARIRSHESCPNS